MLKNEKILMNSLGHLSRINNKGATNELLHWLTFDCEDQDVVNMTNNKYGKGKVLAEAIKKAYQALGVEGPRGAVSNFMFINIPTTPECVYLIHVGKLTDFNKLDLEVILGVKFIDYRDNITKLIWA